MTKKPYIGPAAKKVEIDGDVLQMLTKLGFADLFWEKLTEARKVEPGITQEAVFNMLNEKYLAVFGSYRYSCFDSFRIVRDKK